MAKVPLQNISAWSHMKTVEEASNTVSRWPEWKRERQLSSPYCAKESSDRGQKQKENRKSS